MSSKNRSTAKISEIMRKVKSVNTAPERQFISALQEIEPCVELNRHDLPGKPDVTIPTQKVAVFIDGDYWHGNQWKRRGKISLEEQFTNAAKRDYWLRKIRRNMQRDAETTAKLLQQGWLVLRFWESDIQKNLEHCIKMTLAACEQETITNTATLLPQKTVAEFFAGIGLMRIGLEQCGWNVVYANDIDPQKRAMYLEQFPDAAEHFSLKDVHLVTPEEMPTTTLATASFPCNDLSLAGARAGLNGRESSAFWGFIRVLEEMQDKRPPLVLLENVPGLLTSHQGSDFAQTLTTLNQLGYHVDAFLLDAAQFVPQSRQRLFAIGAQSSLLPDQTSTHSLSENTVRPKQLINFIQSHPEINWTIRPLPEPPSRTTNLADIVEDCDHWWNETRTAYLLNQMSESHRAKADAMIATEKWSYGTVFRRTRAGKSMAELRTDGIAGCLRTPRGGSGRQILVKAGFGKFYARLLTPRECARLMGADEYSISASLNQALFGFGDAVCVPAINWIATYYLNPLLNELMHNRPMIKSAP